MRVYITVDTETSLGGAWRNPGSMPVPLDDSVYGRCSGGEYGITLIMNILEEHGFQGTFFIEVFCAYLLGHDQVAGVIRNVRSRGHDAQLHLHPVQRLYRDFLSGGTRREQDLMFEFTPGEQYQLITEGVHLFAELAGFRPRAYRAGCYGAAESTLRALRDSGVEIDSSYNAAYLGNTCGFQTPALNAPAVIEGVHEFPVTVFSGPGWKGYKPLEISAVSVSEIMSTLRQLRAAGCQDAVLVLHSFSLMKHNGLRFENSRPDRIVIRRLRSLCAALQQLRGEIAVQTLGTTDLRSIPIPQPQVIPAVGWIRPAVRKLVQGINRSSWL